MWVSLNKQLVCTLYPNFFFLTWFSLQFSPWGTIKYAWGLIPEGVHGDHCQFHWLCGHTVDVNKFHSNYRASQKNNPLGKIRYLWNCCRFFRQIYSFYRGRLQPHMLRISLYTLMRFNRYNSLNFKIHLKFTVIGKVQISNRYTVSGKKRPECYGHNSDKFRQFRNFWHESSW